MIIVDANEDALGPDGEEFIIALQKFMTSFLRSQRGPVGGIEVDVQGMYSSPRCYWNTLDHNSSEPESILNEGLPLSNLFHSNQDFLAAAGVSFDIEPLLDGVVSESEESQDQEGIEPIDGMYKTSRLTSVRR